MFAAGTPRKTPALLILAMLPILEISDLHKAFGPVRALSGVDFELRTGEVHAIVGENGAGKSTLMNIIDGILQPDSGDILLEGKKVTIGSPSVAQQMGIGFVHQEIALCPDVSVAENIFMASTNASRSILMDYTGLQAKAKEVLSQLTDIHPSEIVGDLPISKQQLVEIAKALTLDCRILILDEPTAALTETEAQVLFQIMRQLSARGISIIYISHRMVEIFESCDRVTVLRDGKYVCTHNTGDISADDIVSAMVGRVIENLYPAKQTSEEKSEDVIFRAQNLSESRRFRDISFDLYKGEILGISGLIGAGKSEIAKGICRIEGQVTGDIELNGSPLNISNYSQSIANGVVYLSEDRKGHGVFLDMAVDENISALNLRQIATRLGLIRRKAEQEQAARLGSRLNLKYGALNHPVSSLSGGNQQKVALAKMLSVAPRLIFLDEPTRGVDVGAKAEIHRILRDLARSGVGIVMISSELPELIGLCDRVLVIREGEISGEVTGDAMTEENMMRLASVTEPVQA